MEINLSISQWKLYPSVVEDCPVAALNVLEGAHKVCINWGLQRDLSFGSKVFRKIKITIFFSHLALHTSLRAQRMGVQVAS